MKTMTLDTLRAKRKEILDLADRHKAEQVRVFGSVARGEATARSDVDLLVHFRSGASLLDLIGLQQEASDLMQPIFIVLSYPMHISITLAYFQNSTPKVSEARFIALLQLPTYAVSCFAIVPLFKKAI